MMSAEDQELRAIAFLAARCRPTGAKHWDEAGIVANLRKVAHINLAELTMATIRAASNRQADNPGVIPVLTGEHWREKVTETVRARPPKRHEECRTHAGQFATSCGGCHADRLAGDDPRETPPPMSKSEALAAARAALTKESA